jgi:hypothetical protein
MNQILCLRTFLCYQEKKSTRLKIFCRDVRNLITMLIRLRTFLLPTLFSMVSLGSNAQWTSHLDSIAQSFEQVPRAFARFVSINSFVSEKNVQILGVQAGYDFDDKVIVGLGYHWLQTKISQDLNVPKEGLVDAFVRMRYIAPVVSYTFAHRKDWYVTVPLKFGFGISKLTYRHRDGERQSVQQGNFAFWEPGLSLEYRFWEYFGLEGGLGTRLMLRNNKAIEQQFTSMVFALKFKIRFGELYQAYK